MKEEEIAIQIKKKIGKKIGLASTSSFTQYFFKEFLDKYEIEFILTQTGKKQENLTEIEQWALKNKIPIISFDQLEEHLSKVECVILFSFGKIISKKHLETPKYGWVNIHPSKLPALRGSAPLQYSLLQGLKTSAITVMKMCEKMDAGDIIAQEKFEINENYNYSSLLNYLCISGPKFVFEAVDNYLEGKVQLVTQDHSKATYTHFITKKDHYVDGEEPEAVIAKIKAFGYVYLKLDNDYIKCFLARKYEEGGYININGVEPIYVQKPGKKMMHIRSFLNGWRK